MLTPVVNAALMPILIRAVDIGSYGSVIKLCSGDMCDMAEAVPLCPRLGVQSVDVVVGQRGDERLDVVLEGLALESWDLWFIQRKAIRRLA